MALMSATAVFTLLRRAFDEWNADEAPRLGAAVAFYSALSIGPVLLLVIAVAGLALGTEAVTGAVSSQIQGLVGAQAAEAIEAIIANSRKESEGILAAIVGFGALVLSATGFFGELQAAMNRIFNAPKPEGGALGFVLQRLFSFAMIMGIVVLLMLSLAVSAGLSAVADLFRNNVSVQLFQVLNFVLSFGVTTLLFAMVFKFMPDVRQRWGDVWFGAAVTALLFAVGKSLIGLYLGNAAIGSTYGAAGSLMVFLVWVYYSVQIIFFGAEIAQVHAQMRTERLAELPPEPLPVAIPDKKTAVAIGLVRPVTKLALDWLHRRRADRDARHMR